MSMKIDVEHLRLKLRYKIVYHLGHDCHDVEQLVDETFARFLQDDRLENVSQMSDFATLLNVVCADAIREYRTRISSSRTMSAWD